MYEKFYIAHGKGGRKSVQITTFTMESAERSARQILNENSEINTVAIKNRKGDVIKVIKRWGR